MKLKILYWSTLIAGTILAVFFAFALIFAGANFVEGLTNDTPLIVDTEWVLELLGLFSAFMIILSMILSWFRSRPGGLLLTIFAFLHILLAYEPEIAWMQIAILLIGPLLLVSSHRRDKA